MKKDGLTYKQEAFCQAYIANGGNASAAYRDAYPKSKLWKEGAVRRQASELLKNSDVLATINELQKEQRAKSDVTKEEVLRFVSTSIRVDMRDFMKIQNGKLVWKDTDEWTDEMAMVVEGVKETKNGIELKLAGKSWSVERLCKMLGFDTPEALDVNANINIPQILVKSEHDKQLLDDIG